MPSDAEWDIVVGRVHVLVLGALTFDLAHACEAEGVELLSIGVVRVVVVHPVRVRRHQRTSGDECAVVEHDVLQRFARNRGCARAIGIRCGDD